MGDSKAVDIQLGNAFKERGLHKQLLALRHQSRNLTSQDLAAFETIVEKHARLVSSGSEFSRSQKHAMKQELMKLESLSLVDKKALKKVIDSGM